MPFVTRTVRSPRTAAFKAGVLDPGKVMVVFNVTRRENWSFGNGRQFYA